MKSNKIFSQPKQTNITIDSLMTGINNSYNNNEYDNVISLCDIALEQILTKNQNRTKDSLLTFCYFRKAQSLLSKHERASELLLNEANNCATKAVMYKLTLNHEKWRSGAYYNLKANVLAAYNNTDSLNKATVFFEKAQVALNTIKEKQHQRPDLLIKLWSDWGYALIQHKQSNNARNQFKKCIDFYNTLDKNSQSDNKQDYVRCLNNLGESYYIENKFNEADREYQRAYLENFNNQKGVFSKQIKRKDYNGDLEYLATLLTDIGKNKLAHYQSDKSQPQKLDESINAFLNADYVLDSMRKSHSNTTSKLFWRSIAKSLYESALEACYIRQDTVSAFQFIEKSRAVLLMEHLSNREKEEDTKMLILNNMALVTKTRLQEHNQSLISYFIGNNAVYVYCISNRHTKFLKLKIKPKALKILTSNFYEVCSKKKYEWYEQLWSMIRGWFGQYNYFHEAFEVYQALFEPLNLPKGKSILVSFDGQMIPFEAFLSTDEFKSKNFLLNDYTFSYTYSASYWIKTLNDKKTVSQDLLVVMPVDFNKRASLSGGYKVVDSLRKFNYTIKELKENEATKQNVLTEIQENYGIIYFHTHAHADAIKNIAELYLFKSDTLKIDTLMQKNIKANLVVLTACETAVGTSAHGEGLLSLARGFAYAGVPNTIASTWSIPEESSSKISTDFFKNIHNKQAQKLALTNSKKNFIKNYPNKLMPFFWAGLVLIGK